MTTSPSRSARASSWPASARCCDGRTARKHRCRTSSTSAAGSASTSTPTRRSCRASGSASRYASSSYSSSSFYTLSGCTIASSSSTWSGGRRCTSSRARSTCTFAGCASTSSAMTPTPSSSSPSAEWGTSSYPTRWSHRLVLQFLLPTLAALAGVLVLAVPYIGVTVEQHQVETLAERLLAEAREAGEALPWIAGVGLDEACARLATTLDARVTVIAPDGRVLGESTRSSESLENHADRAEVQAALAQGSGRSVRHSATVNTRLLYVAAKQTRGADARVVRVAIPTQAIESNVAHLRRLLVGGVVAAAFFGLAVALLLSRGMLRRI